MRVNWLAIAVHPVRLLSDLLDGKSLKRLMACALAGSLGMVVLSGAASAGQVSVWQFNSTLGNSIAGGAPMVVNGGWGETYVNTTISGNPATALSFSALTNTQSLQMPNQAAANGGGAKTNLWSIVMDVNFPSVSGFKALWQTDQNIAGSDGDFFINNGAIGISSSYHGAVPANEWTRIAVTVQPNGTTARLNKYINGLLVGTTDSTAGIDGRHSVSSLLHLFADEDGETGAGLVNSVAFYDELLTASDIRLLGGATADGIGVVPEPSSLALGALAIVGSLVARRYRR